MTGLRDAVADGQLDGGGDLVEGRGVDEDGFLVVVGLVAGWEHVADGFEAEVGGGVVCVVVRDGGLEEAVDAVGVAGDAFELLLLVLVHPPVLSWALEGPVDDDAGVGFEGHVLAGPAFELEDGGASRDEASGGEGAGEEDAVGAGDGEEYGVGGDGDGGVHLGAELADLVEVSAGADGGDLGEAESCDGAEEAGEDVHALGVDEARDGGEGGVAGLDFDDLALVEEAVAAVDGFAGDGVDGGVDDRGGGLLRGRGDGEVLGAGGCWVVGGVGEGAELGGPLSGSEAVRQSGSRGASP